MSDDNGEYVSLRGALMTASTIARTGSFAATLFSSANMAAQLLSFRPLDQNTKMVAKNNNKKK